MRLKKVLFGFLLGALITSCSNDPLTIMEEPKGDPVAVENPAEEPTEPENPNPETPDPESPIVPEEPDTPLFDEPEDNSVQQCKEYTPIEFTSEERALGYKLNAFGWRLFKAALDSPEFAGNGAISPVSVTSALAMAANGADTGTLDAMMQTMGLTADDLQVLNSYYTKVISQMPNLDNTSVFNMYNSLWQTEEMSFLQDFVDISSECYEAELYDTTYDKIVDDVNAWCNECTQGLIPKIITNPALISIANAMYFKGNWKEKFDRDLTDYGVFTCMDGRVRTVPFMHKYEKFLGGFGNTHRTVGLEIGNEAFAFYVILPREGKTFEECIDDILARKRLWQYPLSGEKDLALPKYKIDKNIDLVDILSSMGMGDAFDIDKADFSKMSQMQLYITAINHATSIKIDEGGTVVAAATAVGGETSAYYDPEDFHVDRPFLFVIIESNSQTPILIGKVENL